MRSDLPPATIRQQVTSLLLLPHDDHPRLLPPPLHLLDQDQLVNNQQLDLHQPVQTHRVELSQISILPTKWITLLPLDENVPNHPLHLPNDSTLPHLENNLPPLLHYPSHQPMKSLLTLRLTLSIPNPYEHNEVVHSFEWLTNKGKECFRGNNIINNLQNSQTTREWKSSVKINLMTYEPKNLSLSSPTIDPLLPFFHLEAVPHPVYFLSSFFCRSSHHSAVPTSSFTCPYFFFITFFVWVIHRSYFVVPSALNHSYHTIYLFIFASTLLLKKKLELI